MSQCRLAPCNIDRVHVQLLLLIIAGEPSAVQLLPVNKQLMQASMAEWTAYVERT